MSTSISRKNSLLVILVLLTLSVLLLSGCTGKAGDNKTADGEDVNPEDIAKPASEVPQSELELAPSDQGEYTEDSTMNGGEDFTPTQDQPLAGSAGQAAGVENAPAGEVSLVVSFDSGSGPIPSNDGMTISANEDITAQVTVVNKTEVATSIVFPTSQKIEIIISDTYGKSLWRWSEGMRFAQVISSIVLEPDQFWSHEITIRKETLANVVLPGIYNIKVVITGSPEMEEEITGVRLDMRS